MSTIAVVVDQRVKEPYRFGDEVRMVRASLMLGDYTLAGLEEQVVIKRRSLGELLSVVAGQPEWFLEEMRQMRAYRFAALVIEGHWRTVLDGTWDVQSAVHPNAVVGALMAFQIKYGVAPVLAGSREDAGRIVERMLLTYSRLVEKEYKALVSAAKKASE